MHCAWYFSIVDKFALPWLFKNLFPTSATLQYEKSLQPSLHLQMCHCCNPHICLVLFSPSSPSGFILNWPVVSAVAVSPWPACTAEAAVFTARHLWGCHHPGNAWRFITYWYTPSLNTPPKTPTVHCWLMNCTAKSPWIILLKRIFLPFLHISFLWFHILCQVDKVLHVQPNTETGFFSAITCFLIWWKM